MIIKLFFSSHFLRFYLTWFMTKVEFIVFKWWTVGHFCTKLLILKEKHQFISTEIYRFSTVSHRQYQLCVLEGRDIFLQFLCRPFPRRLSVQDQLEISEFMDSVGDQCHMIHRWWDNLVKMDDLKHVTWEEEASQMHRM